jgi:hypothetical protein
VDSAGIENRFL